MKSEPRAGAQYRSHIRALTAALQAAGAAAAELAALREENIAWQEHFNEERRAAVAAGAARVAVPEALFIRAIRNYLRDTNQWGAFKAAHPDVADWIAASAPAPEAKT